VTDIVAGNAIATLTRIGNSVGLRGRFGTEWGIIQLRARIDALEAAVFCDPEPAASLDWSDLAKASKETA